MAFMYSPFARLNSECYFLMGECCQSLKLSYCTLHGDGMGIGTIEWAVKYHHLSFWHRRCVHRSTLNAYKAQSAIYGTQSWCHRCRLERLTAWAVGRMHAVRALPLLCQMQTLLLPLCRPALYIAQGKQRAVLLARQLSHF
jgi:hypothetical protein